MSDNLIRRAREALKDVSPGPWFPNYPDYHAGMVKVVGPAMRCVGFTIATDVDAEKAQRIKADARFIAAARDLVPEMAARLEAQEALLREAMAVLAKAQDQSCEGFCEQLPQADTYTPDMDLDCATCFLRPTLAKLRAHLDGRADEGGVPNGI